MSDGFITSASDYTGGGADFTSDTGGAAASAAGGGDAAPATDATAVAEPQGNTQSETGGSRTTGDLVASWIQDTGPSYDASGGYSQDAGLVNAWTFLS